MSNDSYLYDQNNFSLSSRPVSNKLTDTTNSREYYTNSQFHYGSMPLAVCDIMPLKERPDHDNARRYADEKSSCHIDNSNSNNDTSNNDRNEDLDDDCDEFIVANTQAISQIINHIGDTIYDGIDHASYDFNDLGQHESIDIDFCVATSFRYS